MEGQRVHRLWDIDASVFGSVHVSTSPNGEKARRARCSFLLAGHQVDIVEDLPADSFVSESISFGLDGLITIDHPDLTGRLVNTPLLRPADFSTTNLLSPLVPGKPLQHFQQACQVRGAVIVHGTQHTVESAVGFQDRTWGFRDESAQWLEYAAIVGIFGDEFVTTMKFLDPKGGTLTDGLVVDAATTRKVSDIRFRRNAAAQFLAATLTLDDGSERTITATERHGHFFVPMGPAETDGPAFGTYDDFMTLTRDGRVGGFFPHPDLGRELRVMSALKKGTDAPVPAVLAHEKTGTVLGSPFGVLERAYGQVPGDDPPFVTGGWVMELAPQQRATMYDEALKAIATIQRAHPDTLDLADLREDDLGDTILEQQLEHWRRFYQWAARDITSPAIEKAFEILASSRPSHDGPLVVSWGDARFGNLMFGPDQTVTAILDWEMATLGRPETDLGYFLFFDRVYSHGLGLPRVAGFPDRQATIERFQELTDHTVEDLEWYEAWAALRGSILVLRAGSLMIELGQLRRTRPWQ